MIKHIGRDTYRPRGWTLAFYWNRRDLSERLDGQSYWLGEFVLTVEPPRRVALNSVANPYRRGAFAWTGRPVDFAIMPGYLSLKIRSPGGFDKQWRFGR